MDKITLYAMLWIPALAGAEMFDISGFKEPYLALNEFSRQSGLQLLFDYNFVKYLHVNDVSGEMDSTDALRAMLKGSGMELEFVNDRTVAVVRERTHLDEPIDSETFAHWMRAFDDGPAMSYPYDNAQPTRAITMVLPTGEEVRCGRAALHQHMVGSL
jgi:hypothetical protein